MGYFVLPSWILGFNWIGGFVIFFSGVPSLGAAAFLHCLQLAKYFRVLQGKKHDVQLSLFACPVSRGSSCHAHQCSTRCCSRKGNANPILKLRG